MSSSKYLQTLSTGKTLFNMSFNTTGSHIHTDIGTIRALSTLNMIPTATGHQNPQYQGGALSSDGAWITYNSENLMWPPSEYRPSCSAVSGNMIGFVGGPGKYRHATLSSINLKNLERYRRKSLFYYFITFLYYIGEAGSKHAYIVRQFATAKVSRIRLQADKCLDCVSREDGRPASATPL